MPPPFVGEAVKVREEPVQLGLLPEVKAIETAGVRTELTVMVMAEEEAVTGLAQAALDVT